MKKALLFAALSCVYAMPVVAAEADVDSETSGHGAVHWGYTGAGAAALWGDLAPEFEVCKTGTQQSPINIDKFIQAELPRLTYAYSPSPLSVSNTGRSVQVNYAPGSHLTLDEKVFELQSFQFHTPSEHYLDGAPYPMELEFIHKAEDGAMAIISVLVKVGAHNPVIEGIWQNVPAAGQSKSVDSVGLSAEDLMPEDKSYYTYEGSLTSPPCTEGVVWYVLKEPIEISEKQLTAFQGVFPVNARPIQPLGGRTIQGD